MQDLAKKTLGGWLIHVLREADSALSFEEALHTILDSMKVYFPSQRVALLVVDEDTNAVRIKISRQLSYSFAKQYQRSQPGPRLRELIREQKAILVDPSDRSLYDEVKLEHDFTSAALAPVIKNHRGIGYLHCDRDAPPAYNDSDLLHLQVVGYLIGTLMVKFELQAERRQLAPLDDATGTLKYANFVHAFARELKRADEHNYLLALALLEVPAFARHLDAFGIDRAHRLLADVARLMRARLTDTDVISRYSADQFVVCMAGKGADAVRDALAAVQGEAARSLGADTNIAVAVTAGALLLESPAARRQSLQALLGKLGQTVSEAGRGAANGLHVAVL
jgi:diguanylate cyclase (GGDEF)-like protein